MRSKARSTTRSKNGVVVDVKLLVVSLTTGATVSIVAERMGLLNFFFFSCCFRLAIGPNESLPIRGKDPLKT